MIDKASNAIEHFFSPFLIVAIILEREKKKKSHISLVQIQAPSLEPGIVDEETKRRFARHRLTIGEVKAAERHRGAAPVIDLADEHVPDNVHKPSGRGESDIALSCVCELLALELH